MVRMTADNFDMAQICDSGQCFRMKKKEEGVYSVIAAGRYMEVEQCGWELVFSWDEEEFRGFWEGSFDLVRD